MRRSRHPGAGLWTLVLVVVTTMGTLLPPGSARAATVDPPCYGALATMPAGRSPRLDVVSFGLFYNCADHGWQLDLTTSDNWTTTDLGRIALYFNVDGDPATGCNGYDRAVIGQVVNGALRAQAMVTPGCDPTTFLLAETAAISHPQPNTLELGFANNGLGNPSSFTWHGELSATSQITPDRFPSTGDRAERGFPPVPADNACPVAGAGAGVAVVTDVGRAATTLRRAGLAHVHPLTSGVIRFAGDTRTAAHALGAAGIGAEVSADRLSRYSVLPNDPSFPSQWNLPAINAPAAWDVSTGSPNVAVADLDSGVDGTHPDLQGKLLPGYDVTTGGPLAAGNTDDAGGHGTAVAGIIAAATDNGIGIAGVGWQTKLVEVKLSDPPALSEIVAGIRWAADHGYHIINLSFTGCADPAEGSAVDYARQHGALVVAAAGNDALDGNPRDFPAAFPGVVAVGATSRAGTRAVYSETGPQIGLVAPGGSADGSPDDDLLILAPGGGTRTGSGTSFAAPQVAAVAALTMAADPTVTGDDAGALLLATASHIQSSPDVNYGRGLLNAAATLGAAAHLARAAGTDRFGTAVAVSQMGWPRNSPTVYVASGRTFPDALATGALAGVQPGPVLLTDQCALPAVTAAELHRLQPDNIYVIGGTSAVCPGVDTAILRATGLLPIRIAGADRYQTDAKLVDAGWPTQANTVYLTTGAQFPDGLSGSARAAKDGAPLLLTDTCALPQAVHDELVRLAPTTVTVIGGTSAICQGVLDSVAAADSGATITRIAGPTRVDTGALVVADGWKQSPSVLVASAANFPDALSAGAYAALKRLPLLINDSCAVDPQVLNAVSSLKPTLLTAVGGSSALCGAAVVPLVMTMTP